MLQSVKASLPSEALPVPGDTKEEETGALFLAGDAAVRLPDLHGAELPWRWMRHSHLPEPRSHHATTSSRYRATEETEKQNWTLNAKNRRCWLWHTYKWWRHLRSREGHVRGLSEGKTFFNPQFLCQQRVVTCSASTTQCENVMQEVCQQVPYRVRHIQD